VGFDSTGGATQLRDEITTLGWEKHQLNLLDVAVAERCADGSLTLNGEAFPERARTVRGTVAWLLAGLALGVPPLTGEAVGIYVDRTGGGADEVGISGTFVREVADLIQPGTSVLFVLDQEGDMDAIVHAIRGLGGTVLKTNVDLERARLIQSTLTASPDAIEPHDGHDAR
jgi:uncharacterized membrane protein